jgi:hypothetical protein
MALLFCPHQSEPKRSGHFYNRNASTDLSPENTDEKKLRRCCGSALAVAFPCRPNTYKQRWSGSSATLAISILPSAGQQSQLFLVRSPN